MAAHNVLPRERKKENLVLSRLRPSVVIAKDIPFSPFFYLSSAWKQVVSLQQ
jgi:hypothetical protein